ncbi:MAG TPA: SDR family NAD(P)-dependent oxidoreductase [Rubrobacter sp.]|nr:SDR family NAD(P)-dependent oxidoreductase [Rubrobacter sp.]
MEVLEGKVALVTGASRGVGAAIARVLAEEGAAVVVNYLKNERRAEGVAGGIRERGGRAVAHRADVTDEEAVRGMVEAATERFGPVDILVNNALPDYRFDPAGRKDFGKVGWGDYLHQLGALRGALYCSQAVVPGMVERGGGRIISILSNLINNPVVAYHDYTTAKRARSWASPATWPPSSAHTT